MNIKSFKSKLISLTSAAAVMLSGAVGLAPINAAAEVLAPQEIPAAEGEIVKFADFESSKEFGGEYSAQVDSGNELYGKSLEVFPSEGIVFNDLYVGALAGRLNKDAYVLSFDFMAPQTDHIFKMILRDTADKDISSVYFEHNGKIVIAQNGQTPYNLAKGATYSGSLGFKEVGYYDAGGWHNLTVEVRPNGGGRNITMKWYYDGEFVMDADTSNVNIDSLKNANGIMRNIYIGSQKNGMSMAEGEKLEYDGTEKMYFDNFCFSTYPENSFYAQSAGNGNRININFTEGLSPEANLSNVTIRNTETGQTVGISDIQSGVSSMIVNTREPLEPSVEYCVELDSSIISCMNRTLLTNIYFMTSAADKVEPDVLVYDGSADKYENKNSSFEVRTPSTGYAGSSFIVNMDVTVQNPKSNAFLLYLRDNTGKMYLSGKTCDDMGDFAILKNGAPWLDDAEVKNDNSNYFHAVDAFSSGTKRKVTYTLDAEKRAVGFYLDDVLICERVLSDSESAASMNPGNIYVGVNTAKSENISVNIENVSVYTIKSTKKPSKFRTFNRNGVECEPFTDKTLSNAKSARLYFNCDVNSDSLTNETVLIKDSNGDAASYTIGDYSTEGKYVDIVFDEFLTKGERYTVSASGIKDANRNAIGNYSTEFTVNQASDFYISNIKLINGTEVFDPAAASGTVYIEADMVNTEDFKKPVKVVLFAEKNGQLVGASEKEVTADKNSDTYISNDQGISVSGPDYIKAVFLDAVTGVPYDNEISVGTRTAGDDANKDGFYNSFEKQYEGKADCRYFARVYLPTQSKGTEPSAVAYYSGNADENGKIAFDFRIVNDDLSGEYKISGMFSDGTVIDESIPISNPIEADTLTQEICDSVKYDDKDTAIGKIKGIIESRTYAMSIELKAFDKLDTSVAAEIVYNEINSRSNKSATTDEMKFIINKAVYIEGIRSGSVENIYDISNQLALENTRINRFKKYSFNNDAFAKSVTTGIEGYSIKSFSDFESALYEQFVLKTVKSPDGTDNLKQVMNEFSSEIGVSKDMSSSVYVAIKNNVYNNYSELKKAVDSAKDKEGSSVSRGGGGGGGSAGIRDVNIQTDSIDENKAQEINKNIFDDIDDVEWAKEAIVYLAERKIINGVGGSRFAPNDFVTRAEMAKMIAGVFLTEFDGGENPFSDVSESDWSCEYIKKAYSAGVISGYEDGSFRPNDAITRQDAAVMLYRAAKKFNIEFYAELTKYFADEGEFADYAAEAISNMYNMGFINGVGENKFAPNEKTTRAQTAKIIYAMIQM